jgi:hypothetical protein
MPQAGGITLAEQAGGALLVAVVMRSAPALRVDLCSQMSGKPGGRIVPVRIGYRFDDVTRMVARSEGAAGDGALRNVALSGPETADMPQVQVSGNAVRDFAPPARAAAAAPGRRSPAVRWIGDAGRQGRRCAARQPCGATAGWWRPDAALHIVRRPVPVARRRRTAGAGRQRAGCWRRRRWWRLSAAGRRSPHGWARTLPGAVRPAAP